MNALTDKVEFCAKLHTMDELAKVAVPIQRCIRGTPKPCIHSRSSLQDSEVGSCTSQAGMVYMLQPAAHVPSKHLQRGWPNPTASSSLSRCHMEGATEKRKKKISIEGPLLGLRPPPPGFFPWFKWRPGGFLSVQAHWASCWALLGI